MIRALLIIVLAAGAVTLGVATYKMLESTRADMLKTFHQGEDDDTEAMAKQDEATLTQHYGPHRECTISQRGEAWVKSCVETEEVK